MPSMRARYLDPGLKRSQIDEKYRKIFRNSKKMFIPPFSEGWSFQESIPVIVLPIAKAMR